MILGGGGGERRRQSEGRGSSLNIKYSLIVHKEDVCKS